MSEIDHAEIYRDTRLRITDLVCASSDEMLDRIAPATPAWRARDIVAHLAGGTADIVSGNLTDLASDAWTQAQVEARRNSPIREVLDEWARCSEVVEPMVASLDQLMRLMLLADAVTHEHDLRGALGVPGERDSQAIAVAFDGISGAIGAQRAEAGALRIIHEAGETVVGSGEPTATLRTTRFEIVRAGVGRRSLPQIAAWTWEGESLVSTVVLSRFAPTRSTALEE